MFRDNITALFRLYIRPGAAFSRILDRGRMGFALPAAVAVTLLLHAAGATPRALFLRGSVVNAGLYRFISYDPGSYFGALFALALAVTPAIVLCRAVAGWGSFAVLLRAHYLPLLMCLLMAWAAAYLPLAAARWLIQNDWLDGPALNFAASVYFAALAAVAIGTIFGAGPGAAAGIAIFGWAAGVFGTVLLAMLGGVVYYLASPLVLYYLYTRFGSEARSFGDSLRSRRHLLEQLEISTNNPHDADAHYQLGLIYQARRQYSEAIARFDRAIAIDRELADAHYQLGRIALEQERFADAIRALHDAAALDDKLALSDVWRDLGAAFLGAGRLEEAASALAKYVERRPYDPEGLFRYGETLVRLGRAAEARELFERCMEAVRTTPANRRAQVRKWNREASSALREAGRSS